MAPDTAPPLLSGPSRDEFLLTIACLLGAMPSINLIYALLPKSVTLEASIEPFSIMDTLHDLTRSLVFCIPLQGTYFHSEGIWGFRPQYPTPGDSASSQGSGTLGARSARVALALGARCSAVLRRL